MRKSFDFAWGPPGENPVKREDDLLGPVGQSRVRASGIFQIVLGAIRKQKDRDEGMQVQMGGASVVKYDVPACVVVAAADPGSDRSRASSIALARLVQVT